RADRMETAGIGTIGVRPNRAHHLFGKGSWAELDDAIDRDGAPVSSRALLGRPIEHAVEGERATCGSAGARIAFQRVERMRHIGSGQRGAVPAVELVLPARRRARAE